MPIDFKGQAEALRDELVARRRDLHRHPELGFEEVRTAGIVAQELTKLGLEVQTGVGKTGVVGILEGQQDGPTILVRADMDALPIHEANTTDYISTTAGKMHACGHDGHTAIALGTAKLLSQYRDQIQGRIKFVFQPAEEISGGAKAMIADGVLENPRPDISLGLHLWNTMPLGQLAITEGPSMAGASSFRITITGRGGHAGSPHTSIDPVVCAAQLISALQTIVSRNVDPLESAVLTVTYIRAGDAYNIIPEAVELRGTVRAFKKDVRNLVWKRMQEMSESLCSAMDCSVNVEIENNTEPVANDPEVAARLRPILGEMVGMENLYNNERTMGAEDMGFLMDDIPGTYFFVGSANAERELNFDHHHPRFDFDEDALPLSVALLSAATAAYVLPDAQ